MGTVQRTIKRVSRLYSQLWDGVRGKTQQQLRYLQQTNADLEHQLLEANAQVATLQHTLTESQQRETALTQQLSGSTRQYEQLQQSLSLSAEELQQHLDTFKATETHLQQQLTQAQQRCKELQQSLENAAQNEADLGQQLTAATQQCVVLEKELNELLTYSDQEIHSLETDLDRQQAAFANCQVQLGEALASASRTVDNIAVEERPLSLADWKIALIGGHENTTRGVHHRLQKEYNLQTLVDIPSVHMPQQQLKQKLENCDLIVSIVGYSNHALTQSVADLKNKGALRGEIFPVNCRGVSGVVREILRFVRSSNTP